MRHLLLLPFLLCSLYVKAQAPKLIIPIGHTAEIIYAGISPDGKKMISLDSDSLALMWDVKTGFLLKKFEGEKIKAIRFTTNGENIITSHKNTSKVWNTNNGKLIADLQLYSNSLYVSSISNDGSLFFTCDSNNIRQIGNIDVNKINLFTGRRQLDTVFLDRHNFNATVYSAIFSADGSKLFVSSGEIYNTSSGEKLSDTCKIKPQADQISPNGKCYGVVDESRATLYETETNKILLRDTNTNLQGAYKSVRFSFDGQKVIVANEYEVKILDMKSGKILFNLERGSHDEYQYADFSPDAKLVIACGKRTASTLWNAENGKKIATLKSETWGDSYGLFSADGSSAITVADDKCIRLWNAKNGKLQKKFKGRSSSVSSSAFFPDGKRVIAVSSDLKASIWNLEKGTIISKMEGHGNDRNGYSFSKDLQKLPLILKNTVRTWNVDNGKAVTEIKEPRFDFVLAKYSPNNTLLLTVSGSSVQVWDSQTGLLKVNLAGDNTFLVENTNPIWHASFSPDEKTIITGNTDETVSVFDANNFNLLRKLTGHTGMITSINFSNNGQKLITASWDSTARVWDLDNGRFLLQLKTGPIDYAEFSSDDRKILTTDGSNMSVWDSETGRLIFEYKGTATSSEKENIQTANFSPNGSSILINQTKTVSVLDAETGETITELKGHSNGISSANFSPTGETILTSSLDNTNKI